MRDDGEHPPSEHADAGDDRGGVLEACRARRRCGARGLTQQEFAARYQIPRGTLRDWNSADRANPAREMSPSLPALPRASAPRSSTADRGHWAASAAADRSVSRQQADTRLDQ